ncbi:MAG TPA: hypothetical protein VK181_02625 [Rhizobium sp.]|nr:hypothetical protein [Rhizobium sp.]
MTFGLRIRLKPFVLSALPLLFLTGCLQLKSATPPPSASKLVEAGVPVETITTICLGWFNSQPTWQDSDAEQTKDEIDYSYRTQEIYCAEYMKGT